MRQQRTEPAAIEAEIARLRSLALDAVRRRCRAVFERTPPAGLSKNLLGRMISISIIASHATSRWPMWRGTNIKSRSRSTTCSMVRG
jgi:hypothetical protein